MGKSKNKVGKNNRAKSNELHKRDMLARKQRKVVIDKRKSSAW